MIPRGSVRSWPKLFQNMRASCETEWLNKRHPVYVAAAWIGHSVKVQRDSYTEITDRYFECDETAQTVYELWRNAGFHCLANHYDW